MFSDRSWKNLSQTGLSFQQGPEPGTGARKYAGKHGVFLLGQQGYGSHAEEGKGVRVPRGGDGRMWATRRTGQRAHRVISRNCT